MNQTKKGKASDVNYDFTAAKKRWHQLCKEHEGIILYMKDWFWDATAPTPEDWRVIIYEKNGISAAFPFLYYKIHGMWRIESPWQVARSGVWVDMPKDVSIEKKIHVMNEIVNFILDRLPRYDFFNINFNTDFDNWSPFYWKGFSASVNYTYTISGRAIDDVKSSFSRRRKQRINSGKKKYDIKIDELDPDGVWNFYEKSYESRKKEISFSKDQLEKLLINLKAHNAVQIRSAHLDNEIVAVEVALLDQHNMYHQFCTHLDATPDAQSLITYDAILFAMETGRKFDFEGSMIKGPAEFYISYLPSTEVCYCIHDESRKYKILDSIRKVIILIKESIMAQLRGGIISSKQNRNGESSVS